MGIKAVLQGLGSRMKKKREISKRNKLIKQEQRAVIEQYQLMGEKVYVLFNQGADVGEMFEGFCKNIDGRLKSITNCHKEISEINGEAKCPKCGGEIKKGIKFCTICGEKIGAVL